MSEAPAREASRTLERARERFVDFSGPVEEFSERNGGPDGFYIGGREGLPVANWIKASFRGFFRRPVMMRANEI